MATPEPDLSRLTPSQRLRWRVSAVAYAEALNLDLDQFPPETAMLLDRTRTALGDMLRLAGEIPADD